MIKELAQLLATLTGVMGFILLLAWHASRQEQNSTQGEEDS